MKFSQASQNNAPALVDYLMGVTTGNVDFRVTLQNLITILLKQNYISIPYKWSGYRSIAVSNSGSVVPMDTKNYDTGNNYNTSTGIFTAPESGYYFVLCQMTLASGTPSYFWTTIFKNGTEWRRGNRMSGGMGSGWGGWVMGLMFLTAGDQVSLGFATSATVTLETGADNLKCVGEIFMQSKT